MNLIALPHTNPFVRLVKVERQVNVSGELDERIQNTPYELRPVALLLVAGMNHRQAGEELGLSRRLVQRQAAVIKGESDSLAENTYEKKLWLLLDLSQRQKITTEKIRELRAQNMKGEDVAEELNRLGILTDRGCSFNYKAVYDWMERHNLPMNRVKNQKLYDRVIELRNTGLTFKTIAQILAAEGIPTQTKKGEWTRKKAESVYRTAKRT